MANTNPVADNPVVIEYVKQQRRRKRLCQSISDWGDYQRFKREELAEMGEMAAVGAVAFSDDGKTIINPAVLRSAMEYSTLFNLPLLLHEEEPNLAVTGSCMKVIGQPFWVYRVSLPWLKTIMIARDLLMAGVTEAKVHFCHVSAKGSVDLIKQAKQRGMAVTAEATPHHFSLTDAAIWRGMIRYFGSVLHFGPRKTGKRFGRD